MGGHYKKIKMVRINSFMRAKNINDTPRSQQLVLRSLNTRFYAEDGDLATSVPNAW